jgi:hypothetical protein
MKIGVIADTHIPARQAALPEALKRAFAGVDIILHAGDICSLDVLRELQNQFTITMAVCGEGDDADVRRLLESQKVVELAKRRIGMVHGGPAEPTNWWRRLLGLAAPLGDDDVRQTVMRAFAGEHGRAPECIVYGHTHRAYVGRLDGVLLFNPGAAAPFPAGRSSVGILEIAEGAVDGRIIYLDEV